MNKKKMIVVSAMALSIVGSAFGTAATFTLNESLSGTDIDWTVKESYVGASRDPIEGDTVVIPAGVTANIAAGTPSWGLLTSLKRVVPRKDSILAITVPETFEGHAVLPVHVLLLLGRQRLQTGLRLSHFPGDRPFHRRAVQKQRKKKRKNVNLCLRTVEKQHHDRCCFSFWRD